MLQPSTGRELRARTPRIGGRGVRRDRECTRRQRRRRGRRKSAPLPRTRLDCAKGMPRVRRGYHPGDHCHARAAIGRRRLGLGGSVWSITPFLPARSQVTEDPEHDQLPRQLFQQLVRSTWKSPPATESTSSDGCARGRISRLSSSSSAARRSTDRLNRQA